MKKIVFGFIIGVLLFGTTSIYAVSINEVKAFFTDFKLTLHGKEIPLSNKIVSINGNSYLPVKEISNLLGYQVAWEQASKTVKIGDTNTIDSIKSDSINTTNAKIVIPDKNLESIIRRMINKPSGDIHTNDVKNITGIYDDGQGIQSLEGLQYLKNLKELQLSRASLSDLKPLSQMIQLEFLDLYKCNIVDISVLSNMKNLKTLSLSDNNVTDISALRGLVNLESLYLNNNKISDLSAISNLTKLHSLTFSNNPITDISPLKNLTNVSNKYNTDNSLIITKDNMYYRIPYSKVAFRIDDKLYLNEHSTPISLFIDKDNKKYLDSFGMGIQSLLSINYGMYTSSISQNDNPFVDGMITTNSSVSFIEAENKYSSATETFIEGKIFNKERSSFHSYRYKKGDYLGVVEVSEGSVLLPISEIFDKFDIDFSVDYDNDNRLIVFSFN